MAEGHDEASERGPPGKLRRREEIKAIAQAAVLGVSDGLTLLQSEDSELLLAAQAVNAEALILREQLDDNLATQIIIKLGEAFAG